jgi:hypothetical protein
MFPLRSLALSLSIACSVHALAQECNRLFQHPVTYRFDATVRRVAAADFDSDGRPDVAAAAAPSLHILLNRDGVLAHATPAATPDAPLAVFATNADGDGRTDLVSHGAAFIATHYSNGDGTFRTVTTAVTGNLLQPLSVLADMNGDGKSDLLSVAQVTGQPAGVRTLRIFAGTADGTFSPLTETPQPLNFPAAIAPGDWNRDGKPDVVVVNGVNAASFHTGTGNGTFGAPQSVLPGEVTAPRALASGDFDGDGVQDLAVSGQSVNALYLSSRGPDPVASEDPIGYFSLFPFDVDRDGKLDLVGDAAITPGNGDGTFRRQVTNPWYVPGHGSGGGRDLVMADLDGDGQPDMISAAGDTIRVLYNRGNFRFDGIQLFLTQNDRALAADVNRDGRDDLITFYYANMVFLSGPGGMLGEPAILGNGGIGPGVAGDFNGDSHLDLASTGNWIAFGDGTGHFSPARDLVASSPWGDIFDVITADVNGDGSTDIVFSDSPDDLWILTNDGTGVFTVTRRDLRLLDLAAGDFDRNGKSDLLGISDDDLLLFPDGGATPVTLLDGVRAFTRAGGSTLEVADVDGDGLLDAVALAASGTELLVLGGNGNGTFRSPRSVPLTGTGNPGNGFDEATFTSADFTGDGRIDFVVGPWQRMSVLLAQQPDGSFVEVSRMETSRHYSLTSGDFDGDGHPDLLARDPDLVYLYLNRCREELRATPPVVDVAASASRAFATLRASVPGAAAGFVEFFRRPKSGNWSDLVSVGNGEVSGGNAWLTVELPEGTHEIYAVYSGDGAYARSYSRTIELSVSEEVLPRRRSVRH